MTCFSGFPSVLRAGSILVRHRRPPSQDRAAAAEPSIQRGVAALGSAEAEAFPQRAPLVGGAVDAPAPAGSARPPRRSRRGPRRSRRGAGGTRRCRAPPGQQLVDQLAGRADEAAPRRTGRSGRPTRRGGPCGAAAASAVGARNTTRSAKTRSGSPRRSTSCSARRTSATQRATSAVSAGVTHTTSTERAAKRKGTAWWARATTSGLPCGGRGTIEGPFTEKNRPSKST